MVRAGEPTDGDLMTWPPVEHAETLLHKKANDSYSTLPRAAEFLLLLPSLQAVEGPPAAFSEAERDSSHHLCSNHFS